MTDLFFRGGMPGMIIITVFGLGAITWGIASLLGLIQSKTVSNFNLNAVLFLGSMSFFLGMFWQAIGLYDIFAVIEEWKEVTQLQLAGGLKASMIGTLWGAMLFFIAALFWFVLRWMQNKQLIQEGA